MIFPKKLKIDIKSCYKNGVNSNKYWMKYRGKRDVGYQKIIEEAVEQSNRDFIPELSELHTLKELASFKFDRAFIAYEEESMMGSFIPNEYIPTKDSIVVAMIGPEGGFSKDEVDKIVKMGFESISLGKRILKAETACCYLLSILSYKGECQWLTLSLFHI